MLILGLFVVDIAANELYLYWTYVWLDNVMHALGGFAAAFFVLICIEFLGKRPAKMGIALIGAVAIGIVWEVTEFSFHISRLGPGFISDTAFDLMMDIIGGLIAYFIWTQLPQQTNQPEQLETKNN